MGNLFWGMQFAPFSHKTTLDRQLVLSRLFRVKTARSHTAITSIVVAKATNLKNNSSLRGVANAEAIQTYRHTERSEVSKSRESNKNSELMTQKRINKSYEIIHKVAQ